MPANPVTSGRFAIVVATIGGLVFVRIAAVLSLELWLALRRGGHRRHGRGDRPRPRALFDLRDASQRLREERGQGLDCAAGPGAARAIDVRLDRERALSRHLRRLGGRAGPRVARRRHASMGTDLRTGRRCGLHRRLGTPARPAASRGSQPGAQSWTPPPRRRPSSTSPDRTRSSDTRSTSAGS